MHKSLNEILALPRAELRLWRAHLAKDPPLEERLSYYLPQITAAVYNSSMNRAKGSETLKPSDLNPWFDPWNETGPSISSQMATVRAALKTPETDPE